MVATGKVLILGGVYLALVVLALYRVNVLLEEQLLGPFRSVKWIRGRHGYGDMFDSEASSPVDDPSVLKNRMTQVESEFLSLAMHLTEEVRRMEDTVMELETDIQSLKHHMSHSLEFYSLKDEKMYQFGRKHYDRVHHYFMSNINGRGIGEGPPELFYFPTPPIDAIETLQLSEMDRATFKKRFRPGGIVDLGKSEVPVSEGNNVVEPRLLCLRGNATSNGTSNSYALAFKEAIPPGAQLVPGITLITDSDFDFRNPWHSMFNLLPFVYWRMESGCSTASNLLLFHQGEYRTSMGSWIKSIMEASSLPTSVLRMVDSGSVTEFGGPMTTCFEQAVVSRRGLASMKKEILSRVFREARCQARRACYVNVTAGLVQGGGAAGPRHVNVTLLIRHGGRGFLDEAEWIRVVKMQCEAAPNCHWSVFLANNLTFCEQVVALSHTNILLSAHGAQVTNMIFMEPGGSLLEFFPKGWLEMAGEGQFVFKRLAKGIGLYHEGYWRDPSTPPCPHPNDVRACFDHYKNQPLGINATHISKWLGSVIRKFQISNIPANETAKGETSPLEKCEC